MKRRFLQIHLLTAVVGMLTASGLLWLNLKEQRIQLAHPFAVQSKAPLSLQAMYVFNKGWPQVVAQERSGSQPLLTFMKKDETSRVHFASNERKAVTVEVPWKNYYEDWIRIVRPSETLAGIRYASWQDVLRDIPEVRNSAANAYPPFDANAPRGDARFYRKAVAINAAVAFAILVVSMIVIEWILRRRERAKV